jgi:hypothetical protein
MEKHYEKYPSGIYTNQLLKDKKTLQESGMINLEDYIDFKNHLVRRVKYDGVGYKEDSAQKIRNYFITKEK